MTWALHHAECVEFMRGMADGSVGHIICDPPYSAHVHANTRTTRAKGAKGAKDMPLGFDSLDKSTRKALAEQYARIVRRWVLIFGTAEEVGGWKEDLEAAGLEYIRTGCWIRKGAPQISGDRPAVGWETISIAHPRGAKKWNGGGNDAVWIYPIPRGDDRMHPTQKPLDLMRALVSDFTDPGELILDSHAGSGTTGVACIELGRDFIGIERDAKHYATAHERLTNTARQEILFSAPMKQQTLTLVNP